MDNLVYEHVLKLGSQRGVYLSAEKFQDIVKLPNPGYVGVYGFVDAIPWTNRLYLDLDTGSPDAACEVFRTIVKPKIDPLGARYTVWNSGSKGIHVVIEVEDMYGLNVPYSQFVFVRSLGIDFDHTLYRKNSLISLPGRVHPDTGNRKIIIPELCKSDGRKLKIDLRDIPQKEETKTTNAESIRIALSMAEAAADTPPSQGNRHMALWNIGLKMALGGRSISEALMLVRLVNSTFPVPKDDAGLVRALEQAYEYAKRQ